MQILKFEFGLYKSISYWQNITSEELIRCSIVALSTWHEQNHEDFNFYILLIKKKKSFNRILYSLS